MSNVTAFRRPNNHGLVILEAKDEGFSVQVIEADNVEWIMWKGPNYGEALAKCREYAVALGGARIIDRVRS